MNARDRGIHIANFDMWARWRGRRSGIERRMKGENTERAEHVVGDDLGLRVELASRVGPMEMGEGKELGSENQDGAEERNRFCATSNRPADSSPPRNHRLHK